MLVNIYVLVCTLLYIEVQNTSFTDMILTAVIATLCGSIGAYAILKLTLKKAKSELPDMILDLIDELTPELPKLLDKDEVKNFVYSLGVLVGNGAKSGAFGNVGKGKFKFQDLLMGVAQQVAPAIVQKIIPAIGSAVEGQQSQQEGKW